MRATTTFVPTILVLISAACASGPTAGELNQQSVGESMTSGTNTSTDGAPAVTATSSVTTGGASMMSAATTTGTGTTGAGGASSGTGGPTTTDAGGMGGGAATPVTTSSGGMGGTGSTTDASTTGGVGGSGTSCAEGDAYCPRSGPFNMLVYSKIGVGAFRHDSIPAGRRMLEDIADEWGFNVTITDTNELINAEGLAQFEVVFFMNCTGDIFNSAEEAAFEAWIKNGGAWVGVHSATDTESGWAFYKELTGQYYDGHGMQDTPGQIIFESDASGHPAVEGIPNPWNRNEEWYNFNSFQQWQTKPGLKVLGRKQADNQPIVWAREYDTYRTFYTALGHASAVFQDPVFIQHITGGIMWTVRRDHLSPPLQ